MVDREQMVRRQRVLADFGEFALRSDDLDAVDIPSRAAARPRPMTQPKVATREKATPHPPMTSLGLSLIYAHESLLPKPPRTAGGNLPAARYQIGLLGCPRAGFHRLQVPSRTFDVVWRG